VTCLRGAAREGRSGEPVTDEAGAGVPSGRGYGDVKEWVLQSPGNDHFVVKKESAIDWLRPTWVRAVCSAVVERWVKLGKMVSMG
jgi:hypothetical protein